MLCYGIFFFSSRRRHTRCLSDWSSDVCSSDLIVAVLDRYPISKSTERLKNSWIGFVAPQPQTRCDVQRHLVPSVRNAADWRPPVVLQHAQNSKVFDQAVAQSAIELQDVAIRPHLRVANQISRIL